MQYPARGIQDMCLKASDGVMKVDGHKKVGGLLQRCLEVAKVKSKTSAGDPYGTICTK